MDHTPRPGRGRVTEDPSTLPEPLAISLLRARHRGADADRQLVTAALRDAAPRARVLALRAAAAHQWLGDAEWRAALDDVDPEVRRTALSLLAHAKTTAALAAQVRARLDDPKPLVVDAACFALGEHRAKRAITALCRVARDHPDARCREAAIAALGAIGDARCVPTVIAALEDKAPIRRRAIVALSAFEGPEVEAALARAAADHDWQVRAAVDQLDRGPLDDR